MKVYIRKVPRGFSGHNFASCFMISYSDLDKPRHDAELLRYMSHEMTHNWAYLGNESDGYQNMWFIEGIADFYALYLPVMAGVKGLEYFCQTLDDFLTIYYTSPYLRTPLRQVPDDANGILVSYRRGFMYFLFLDAQLRAAAESRGESSQDQIAVHSTIMTICHKNWNEGGTNSAFRRETLYAILGREIVDASIHDMMDGKVLQPHPELTFPVAGKTVKLKTCEQATIDLGFSDRSFNTRIIEGLVPGSKAQLAGLQNGDKLVSSPSLSSCRMDPERPFGSFPNGETQQFTVNIARGPLRQCLVIAQKIWTSRQHTAMYPTAQIGLDKRRKYTHCACFPTKSRYMHHASQKIHTFEASVASVASLLNEDGRTAEELVHSPV